MNVLFLSTIIPYPPVDGHSHRTYYLLKHLAENHRIHLIGFVKKPDDWDSAQALSKFCASVHPFLLPEDFSRISLGLSLTQSLFSSDPFVVRKYLHPPAQAAMERILRTEPIHLIHCDMPNLIAYVRGDSSPPTIAVHHDLEWLLMYRRAKAEPNFLKRWYFFQQAKKWRQFLPKMERKTRLHVVVSEVDRKRLEEASFFHRPARVVPNGVDIEYFQPQPSIPTEKMVVLLGGMHLFQNADGAEYFLESVWPKIKALDSGIACLIVGQKPSSRRLKTLAARAGGVRMLGFISDVRPLLARAGLMVVPIRIGSGTRLKILSAMAMGKAVVSTSIGCEGIEARAGEELLVADTADDMARQVVEVLQNQTLRLRLGENARRLVEERYSWAKIARIMEDIYREAVEDFYAS